MGRFVGASIIGMALLLPPTVAPFVGAGNAPDPAAASFAVVAVIDTGVSPGLLVDLGLTAHPSTYITDYPSNALPLDFNATGAQLDRLYYFPGSRVVGAISLGMHVASTPLEFCNPPRLLLDNCAHGAVVAMRAAAQSPDVLIVDVQVSNAGQGIEWAMNQSWIDVISVSMGSAANLPLNIQDGNLTRQATERGKIVVVGAGNGATNLDLPDRTLTYTSGLPGPSWVVSVGAVSECSQWDFMYHSIPVDVVAPSPPGSGTPGGGTSFATPIVSGQMARVIAEARRSVGDVGEGPRQGHLVVAPPGAQPQQGPLADGILDRLELEAAVEETAHPSPMAYNGACGRGRTDDIITGDHGTTQRPTGWGPADMIFEGYGIVDRNSGDHAVQVVLGNEPIPARPIEDAFMIASDAIRDRIWVGADDGLGAVPVLTALLGTLPDPCDTAAQHGVCCSGNSCK